MDLPIEIGVHPFFPGKNGSGKLIAEALTFHGFMTLRYDKRGSGPHVCESVPKMIGKVSIQSHKAELDGAMKTLISTGKVDSNSVFALTNSEGAIHAINYQLGNTGNKFRGLILTGAPGQSVGQVARNQIQDQIKTLPNCEAILKGYDEAVAAFIAGKPVIPNPTLPDTIKYLLLSLTTPVNLPFARELWTYNVSDFIAKVAEPILVVIGKKDIQVDWQIDGKALETATANKKNISFVYPANANHVLKHEDKPREQLVAAEVGNGYNATDHVLDAEALDAILGWLTL